MRPSTRNWLPACTTLLATVPILPSVAAPESAPPPRPNIIVILSDDMGFSDIGCYGGEIETPTLDRLAEGGLRFSQFYNTGRCCPTRASLLTGLYPHQAGMGWMTEDNRLPGYTGGINGPCATIAEVLQPAGYRTYLTGKWHVTRHTAPDGPKHNWPLQRGFERFYGTITGAGSFFDPTSLCRGNDYITPENDPVYQPEAYYYTDAIADNAVAFLREHAAESPDRPFFLYVAFTAAHWPMHALPDDIARYRGRYDQGYGAVRSGRMANLRALGIVPDSWELTPQAGDWTDVEHQEWETRCMEVYAAMVTSMDRGIGRIVAEVSRQARLDDTLILFLQDNGGCAEDMGRRSNADAIGDTKHEPLGRDGLQSRIWPPMQTRDGRPVRTGPDVMPGPADTYIAYGQAWANVSNTPFREYKHWVHEGGVATPLVAHWPNGITSRGTWHHEPGHLIDIMATCADLAGAEFPAERNGRPVRPPEGISLRPAFDGRSLARPQPIFFEHEGNRAVRLGRWKLVAKRDQPWELYDMESDRTEMHDLAEANPDVVRELSDDWDQWAARADVLPLTPYWQKQDRPANDRRKFQLNQGDVLASADAPQTGKRGFIIRAELATPGHGVIAAQGGVTHGFALRITDDGRPALDLRRSGKLESFVAKESLPESARELHFELAAGGRFLLTVDGRPILDGQASGLLDATPADAFSVGLDSNDPVGRYETENPFSGKIGSLVFRLLD